MKIFSDEWRKNLQGKYLITTKKSEPVAQNHQTGNWNHIRYDLEHTSIKKINPKSYKILRREERWTSVVKKENNNAKEWMNAGVIERSKQCIVISCSPLLTNFK